MTDIAAQKSALRREAALRRQAAFAALGPGSGAARLLEALAPHRGAVLAGYMAMRSEAEPLAVMAAHLGPVCVPVIEAAGRPLRFRAWRPDAPMIEGAFGARIPAEGGWLTPRVLIVPLLAFDRRGFRLGYGGGFYDRTLAGLRARGAVTAIGFGFAAQEVAEVPAEATDARLDLIVTEAGTISPG